MKEKLSKASQEAKSLQIQVVKQMLTLATSGFGLVAALAWNSFIQELVNSYIKTLIPNSGMISLLIYAIIVTMIAVLVTLQLSRLLQRIDSPNES